MNFIHFIPHVNRPDLTVLALNSVPALWKNTLLIDNSDNCSLAAYVAKHINFHFAIIRPPVPLTTAQTYNWMRLIAINKNTDFITFMHNDCQLLTEGGDELLLESATAAFFNNDNKVGWVHQDEDHNHDLFCAYKTEMLQDVGEWDWLCCPFYHLDIDYMRRGRRNGWTIERASGVLCKHHNDASSTIKSSKLRGLINPFYFRVSKHLMRIKWVDLNGDWSRL